MTTTTVPLVRSNGGTTGAAGDAAPGASDASYLDVALQTGGRMVRKFLRTPQLLVVSLVQSSMFLLIFRYVFGGAIKGGGATTYVDFLVPGFVATGVLFYGAGAAAGVAEDLEQGFYDRLRSLPIARSAVLAGRALGDTLLLVLTLLVTVAVGYAVGFRAHTGVGSVIGAIGLCMIFGFAVDWVFIAMGLYAGSAQAAQGMSMIVFPFTFVSSAYVPIGSMPGWLQAIARHQPITVVVDAVRALTIGAPAGQNTGHVVVLSLAWAAGIVAVSAPIAVRRYARR